MTETCTRNLSPGWPLGSDLEVIIGHDFFRNLRQLNGHIFCSEALRRLQQATKCSELFSHWQINHKWLVTSKWPLTFKGQSRKLCFNDTTGSWNSSRDMHIISRNCHVRQFCLLLTGWRFSSRSSDRSKQQKYDVTHCLPSLLPFPLLVDGDWSMRFFSRRQQQSARQQEPWTPEQGSSVSSHSWLSFSLKGSLPCSFFRNIHH